VQNRYNQGGEKAADYLVEGELMAAASYDMSKREAEEQRRGIFERVVVAIMNFAGKLTNSKPIADPSEDQGQKILEVAFFYERRREFAKAIEAYNASLKNYAQRKDMLAYIFLHRGFCYSNIGKRAEALADYRQTKAYDPGEGEYGVTAEVLALFLLDINKRLSLVEKMADSVDKGELLYLLMSYHRAIDSLTAVIQRAPDQKAYFFRGRSYEETGNTASAISDYRRTIAMGRQSEWSAKANRRLYILGTFYEANAKLTEESKTLAKAVGELSCPYSRRSPLCLHGLRFEWSHRTRIPNP
jgi:tetratricopeptide (TPR) repeat protein